MSETILTIALAYAQIALALAGCLAGTRILRGPRAQDRVLGLDALYVSVMLLFLVTGMQLGTAFFFAGAAALAAGASAFFAAEGTPSTFSPFSPTIQIGWLSGEVLPAGTNIFNK